jgi:phosphatidylserine/phosphatidylglycerophosphate/cardiolipin synthase-like enzyme
MKLSSLFLLIIFFISNSTWASVTAYFNLNPRRSYTDPYRQITRSGDNLEAVLLDNIANAQRSIFVAVQELRLPLVALALVAKKQAGVDVRVVLERDYHFTVLTARDGVDGEYESTKLNELRALVDINQDQKFSATEMNQRDAIHILKKGGVPIIDDTFDGSAGSGLMHHKFMIIDGETTIVSTANFTLSCIHGDLLNPQSRGNANSMVVIRSGAVADIFNEEFFQFWGNGRWKRFGQSKTYRGPKSVNVGSTRLTIQFSPTTQRYPWEYSTNGLIGKVLQSARSSVQGALFVFSDQYLGNILEDRQQAGVKIGFLVEAKFAWRDYSELLDMAGVAKLNHKCEYEADNRPWARPLAEIGTVAFPFGDMLHHKFAVVDSRAVIVGSQNWSDAANVVNDEIVLIIEDRKIAGQYAQEYRELLKRSRLGVPSLLRSEIRRLETNCLGRVPTL